MQPDTQPNPAPIMNGLLGFQQTAALKTAIEIGLFSAVAAGATTSDAIAQKTGASARGVRILSDYLTVSGHLTKDGGAYGLTPSSAMFLDTASPAYLGSIAFFLTHETILNGFTHLTEAVKTGTSANKSEALEPNHPMWAEFARSMMPMMFMPAQMIAEAVAPHLGENARVLDIAAGHGIFGISVAQRNPTAQIYPLDWPIVLEVAQQNATRMGVADRYHPMPGSAFDLEFGEPYDLILVTNFLHHFDQATNEKFLTKVRQALKPGGIAATLEFVPNDDRISPPFPACFSLMMLAETPSGDAYTFKQLSEMHRNAGFASCEERALLPSPGTLVIGRV